MIQEKIREGALIIDVRSPQEFAGGQIATSINIPLQEIGTKMAELKASGKVIITCCRSGYRSGVAANQLKTEGIEVYNGGGWKALQELL